jgi:hypothetical protein
MFFILKDRSIKQFLEFKNGNIVVYDRASKNGQSILTEYVTRIDTNSNQHKAEFISFMEEMRLDDHMLWRYANAVHMFAIYVPDDIYLEMDAELESYLNKRLHTSDIAAYLSELLIQRNLIRFNDHFLNTYKGQYQHIDKISPIITVDND